MMLHASLRPLRAGLILVLLGLARPFGVAAQADTTVVAGPEYDGGALREGLLGRDYRDLWALPVRVPVLDLDRFGGGLKASERGGGHQTRSLRFLAADGKEYAFRSVNKYPDLAKEPAFQNTLVGKIVRDQVSSLHPAAALVVAPLLDAAEVLHVSPRLVVMPDDPRLGEFREEFAGMLGTIEERPNEVEDGRGGFMGFERIIGTDRLMERLEESPEDQLDAPAYLKARLMDLFLGDWDRHADQWRWAQRDEDGVRYWVPIPRDRDYAFVNYDGWIPGLARNFVPNAVSFNGDIDNVYGLTLNAQALDRRLLAELEKPVYDSLVVFLRQRLTDQVIDDAVHRMPPEYASRSADELARMLKARRDGLQEAADRLFRMLATEVDIRGTDERDLALIERVQDNVVDVRLFRRRGDATAPSGKPYFQRRFTGPQTREVRVYLHGGDDYAVVRGDVGETLMVRVIGGGGDDLMADSSVVRGDENETVFYDSRGENRFVRAADTRVVGNEYEEPAENRDLSGQGFRDWGSRNSLGLSVDYRSPYGLIVGASRAHTRYGFRSQPYAYRIGASGRVAPQDGRVEASLFGDFREAGEPIGYSVLLNASQLEVLRFYGYGNETPATEVSSRYVIPQALLAGQVTANFRLPAGGEIAVGPVVKYTNPDRPDDHPVAELPPYGTSGLGQVGATAEAAYDLRDDTGFPRRGGRLLLGGSAYPPVWNIDETFGEAHAEARGYLPIPAPTEVTLALRAGGQKVWGDAPVHEAAFLGGSRTIRGYTYQRFAGDAALYGSTELRVLLMPIRFLLRGDLGVLGLADAGRVYYQGESPGGWHSAYGGGLWFRFQIRGDVNTLSLAYVEGDKGRFYFKFGVPF